MLQKNYLKEDDNQYLLMMNLLENIENYLSGITDPIKSYVCMEINKVSCQYFLRTGNLPYTLSELKDVLKDLDMEYLKKKIENNSERDRDRDHFNDLNIILNDSHQGSLLKVRIPALREFDSALLKKYSKVATMEHELQSKQKNDPHIDQSGNKKNINRPTLTEEISKSHDQINIYDNEIRRINNELKNEKDENKLSLLKKLLEETNNKKSKEEQNKFKLNLEQNIRFFYDNIKQIRNTRNVHNESMEPLEKIGTLTTIINECKNKLKLPSHEEWPITIEEEIQQLDLTSADPQELTPKIEDKKPEKDRESNITLNPPPDPITSEQKSKIMTILKKANERLTIINNKLNANKKILEQQLQEMEQGNQTVAIKIGKKTTELNEIIRQMNAVTPKLEAINRILEAVNELNPSIAAVKATIETQLPTLQKRRAKDKWFDKIIEIIVRLLEIKTTSARQIERARDILTSKSSFFNTIKQTASPEEKKINSKRQNIPPKQLIE